MTCVELFGSLICVSRNEYRGGDGAL